MLVRALKHEYIVKCKILLIKSIQLYAAREHIINTPCSTWFPTMPFVEMGHSHANGLHISLHCKVKNQTSQRHTLEGRTHA